MIKRIIHWIRENREWLFNGVGGLIIMAIAGGTVTAIAFMVKRCTHDHRAQVLATTLPSASPREQEGSTPTPIKQLDATQEETAAIERGLVALDSHGILRLVDLREGLNSEDPKTLNSLAWHWATCPKKEHIDAIRALKFAQRANELERNSDKFTDTLAAAYARNGKFADAIATEQKAMDIVDEQMNQAGITEPVELTDDSPVNQEPSQLDKAWQDYRERAQPYLRRRNEMDARLQVYRKGLALISPKDYPTPTPEQP